MCYNLLCYSHFPLVSMRFSALFLVSIYCGCTHTSSSDHDADETETQSTEIDSTAEGKRSHQYVSADQLVPPEIVMYTKGCQKFVYNGKHDNDLEDYQRSDCYDSISHKGVPDRIETTVYFQRHGESTWNVVQHHYLTRDLVKTTDAHLTRKGVHQAMVANREIVAGRTNGTFEDKSILRSGSFPDHRIVFATSNLRRATLTFLVTFKHLLKSKNKIHILSALQELSNGSNSAPLAGHQKIPKLSFSDTDRVNKFSETCPFSMSRMKDLINPRCNEGNEQMAPHTKAARFSGPSQESLIGIDRIKRFCTWMYNVAVFGEDFSSTSTPALIPTDFVVTGHSTYLRTFFGHKLQTETPTKVENDLGSRLSRIKNGSIVRFKMEIVRDSTGQIDCSIQPGSSEIVYGETVLRVR